MSHLPCNISISHDSLRHNSYKVVSKFKSKTLNPHPNSQAKNDSPFYSFLFKINNPRLLIECYSNHFIIIIVISRGDGGSAHNLMDMQVMAEDKAGYTDFAYNHDSFDANHNFSFEINGSLPSNSSSSPRSSFSPLLLIETLSRKSFSYGKLPLEPIKLTVLKLDGSAFGITVAKNPTVAQLKQAVEDAFSHLPKHGIGKISWSHVWSQFCLSFKSQKLLQDQDTVGLPWIKDGDQLQFVRHTSISYNLVKERSEKRNYDLEESKPSPSKQEAQHKPEQKKQGDDQEQDNLNKKNKENDEEDNGCDEIGVNITCQCSWAHLFTRLFSYRRRKGHETSYEEFGSPILS